MNKSKAIVRMIILVLVTLVFMASFYFYFRNSRASSPLSDEEYMEQIAAASKRYNVAGDSLVTPTPIPENVDIFQSILNFFFQIVTSQSE